MYWNRMSYKELMALPHRQWSIPTDYKSILVVNTRKKHDSGYAIMSIIGLDVSGEPIEIAATCDDIMWKNNLSLRSDCSVKSGAIRFWAQDGIRFKVGYSQSSTEIEVLSCGN